MAYRDEEDNKEALVMDPNHEDAADDEFEAQAGHASRKCTDVLCLAIFIFAFVCMGQVLKYCEEHGDMRRLYHGYNYLGQLCGVDVDPVTNQTLGEYLYWCPNAGSLTSLDLKHPICVSACPTGSLTSTACVQMPPVVTAPLITDAAGTFQQTFTYEKMLVPDYASNIFAHRYCMPQDNALMGQITAQLEGDWTTIITRKAGEVAGSWTVLLIAGVMSCFLGFAFLLIVNYFACAITVLCLAILIIAPLGAGGYFAYVGHNGGFDDMPSTGDETWDLIVGYSMLALGVLFLVLTMCCQKAIRTAVAVIKTACNCMFALPSLLLEPVINVFFKAIVLSIMLVGLMWLLSCGTIQKVSVQEYAMSELPGSDLSGVFRSFSYTEDEYYYLTYYVFMIFWVMELFTALGQFTVSYAVQLWYFTPYDQNNEKDDVPCCPILGGYCNGIFFHLGSLAFGSFIIAVCRLLRLIMGIITKQMGAGANPAAACLGKICSCILWCFQTCIEFLNKNAYMDIAITSSNFCVAAKRAFKVILSNIDTIAVLNGACWVIQLAGLGAITATGSYLTWLMLRHWEMFSLSTSDHYVDDPILVTIVSGIICAYIAQAFMQVFDTTADCILYCYAIEKIRRDKGQYQGQRYAPQALNELIADSCNSGLE